jgi:dihydroorotate dehydrogenase electron transfer subunit
MNLNHDSAAGANAGMNSAANAGTNPAANAGANAAANAGGLVKKAFLIRNRQIARDIYEMELLEPELAAAARPGQFVMLAINQGIDPFLRRPFGLAGIQPEAGSVRLIYQLAGRGTRQMAGWEAGRQVELLGPLGAGFSWQEGGGRVLLAAGGMGIAPLLPLAGVLRSLGKEVTVFLGVRSLDLVFGLRELNRAGCQVQLATEDGSAGATGFVTLPLEDCLRRHTGTGQAPAQAQQASAPAQQAPAPAQKASAPAQQPPAPAQQASAPAQAQPAPAGLQYLYACGPTPFLKAVNGLCTRYGLPAQLSLEERMGCGLGVCMGCVVQIKDSAGHIRPQRICREGPVFKGEEVVFNG